MPDTITSYNTFVGNTRAKAAQVNTNFTNHRGTLLPINSDSASASDLAHDLGSTDHRWLNAYVQNLNLVSSTTTAGLVLSGDTSNTTGAFIFKINTVTKAVIDTNGIDTSYLSNANKVTYGVTFTASGSFTVPSGVFWIKILGCGAGGGGGGAANTNPSSGGAGGCGAIPYWRTAPVTPGTVLSITVGSGGSGGLANANPGQSGGTGGSSLVSNTDAGTVTFYGAPGGPGGTSNTGGSYIVREPATTTGNFVYNSVYYTRKAYVTRGGRGGDGSATTDPFWSEDGESSVYAFGGYQPVRGTHYGGGGGAGFGAGGAGQTNASYATTATSGGISAGGGGGCGRSTGGGGPGGPGGRGQVEIYYEKT